MKLLVLAVAIFFVASAWADGADDHKAAVLGVQREAAAQGMPTQIFGVQWLQTSAEVRSIRPAVVAEAENRLSEWAEFYGRRSKISYSFKNDNLVIFIVSFGSPATEKDVVASQERLQHDYGGMSDFAPVKDPEGDNLQCSYKRTERFNIGHCFRQKPQGLLEQILFYRTAKHG